MFNIIKTPRNYFTRELLHDSNVAFHCSVSDWRPYWEVSRSKEVFCPPSTVPVVPPIHVVWIHVATDKLPLQMAERLLRAQPVSVANYVKAR